MSKKRSLSLAALVVLTLTALCTAAGLILSVTLWKVPKGDELYVNRTSFYLGLVFLGIVITAERLIVRYLLRNKVKAR